jgi:hypothetical protein
MRREPPDPSVPLVNMAAIPPFIERALEHYQGAPAWFTNWLDELYVNFDQKWSTITLDELMTLQWLYQDGQWFPQMLAVNTIYKLFDRLGRDTTGILGF